LFLPNLISVLHCQPCASNCRSECIIFVTGHKKNVCNDNTYCNGIREIILLICLKTYVKLYEHRNHFAAQVKL